MQAPRDVRREAASRTEVAAVTGRAVLRRSIVGVDQRVFADPRRADGYSTEGVAGDCFRACLATLLGTSYEATPHAGMSHCWFEVARDFTRRTTNGRSDLGYIANPDQVISHCDGIAIGCGPSPRGPFLHAVIIDLRTGATVHDPHPSRAGILELLDVIVLREPWPHPPMFRELSRGAS